MSSCKKEEDDDDNNNNNNEPTYEFKDQVLQGEISGVAWEFKAGKYELDYWDSTEYSVDLYDTTGAENFTTVCDVWTGDFDYNIMFSCPQDTGLYELGWGSQSITLVDWTADPVLNIVLTEGALHIISKTDSTLTGEIDAASDNESYINGYFTISLCQ